MSTTRERFERFKKHRHDAPTPEQQAYLDLCYRIVELRSSKNLAREALRVLPRRTSPATRVP